MQYVDPSLPKSIFGWTSPRLGLEMPIVRYGDRGHPLLLYPTAQADFLENERFWLVKAIEHHIAAGKVQVFSIDSINRHAWMNPDVSIPEKARRQALYSGYIEDEVVPHIRRCVGDPRARLAASGASFGAFHAANAVFRRPDLFDTLIAMSGFYDLGPDYLHGFDGDGIYFQNPLWYLKGLRGSSAGDGGDDGAEDGNDPLHLLRTAVDVFIVTGQGAYEAPWASVRLAEALREKGIPHYLDLWGADVNHDWPWWRRMLDHYLASRVRF